MAIIVLEGPDGSGKTSVSNLIKMFCSRTFVGMKCGPPSSNAYDECIEMVRSAASMSSNIVVIDRLHLGELVYGPMFRGLSTISIEQAREIDARLDKLEAVRAVLLPSLNELIARQMSRDGGRVDEKSGAKLSDTGKIREGYENLTAMLPGWAVFRVGTTEEITAQLLWMITR